MKVAGPADDFGRDVDSVPDEFDMHPPSPERCAQNPGFALMEGHRVPAMGDGAEARIKCAPGLCGTVRWLWDGVYEKGRQRLDTQNADASQRTRPRLPRR